MINLDTTVYLVIKANGNVVSVSRNDHFENHIQYMKELMNTNLVLQDSTEPISFDNNQNIKTKFSYLEKLVLDQNIVLENFKLDSSNDLSMLNVYLPSVISKSQKDIIDSLNSQLDQFHCMFLLVHSPDDLLPFKDLFTELMDIRHGNDRLNEYVEENLETNIKTL